jgi:DNA-binding CsgD family transcriptional regulator
VVQAAAYAGDTSTADAALKALDGLAPTGMLMMEPEVDRARAWHAVLHDDIAAGHRALEAAASRARESGAYALEAGALHDLSRTGRPEAAADRLAELAGVVDGPLTAARARHASVLVADDAAGLDRCANDFVELGALLLAAEAAAAAAASHRGAGASRRAHQSTRHAATLGQRLGGSARTPALALAGPAGELTKREREVTALAAAGRTNAAIAGQLVLSIRTVESHLQRAYEKLGVTSRDELARTLDVDAEPAVLSTDY